MKYDNEEKDILNATEKGVMKLSMPSKEEIESSKAAAKNTLKKDKRITIRLYEHDFIGIQKNCGNGYSVSDAYFWYYLPNSPIYGR